MRLRGFAVLLVMYISATGCGGATTPAAPSQVQIPPAGSITITVSGSVRDATNNAALPGTDVQVTSGPDAPRSTTTDASGNYALTGLKLGFFTLRFTRAGYEIVERPLSLSGDTHLDVRLRSGALCMAPPAPTGFRAVVSGTRVTFSWNPVVGVTNYVILVGSAPGGGDITSINSRQTTFVWRTAPTGTHYSRVVARSDCPHETASNEITFTVSS